MIGTVRGLIAELTEPYRLDGKERIRLTGDDLLIDDRAATPIALLMHELATNAVKYGALSVETGEVAIRWTVGRPQSEDAFRFEWIESGGPTVVKPRRQGFGSRLVERVMAQKFHGEVELDYRPEGLRYVLTTTMANIAPRE